METYSAVIEMRLDCLTERPSCEDIVFCRETGWKEEEEAVEALDAGCSIVATDMLDCVDFPLLDRRAGTSRVPDFM